MATSPTQTVQAVITLDPDLDLTLRAFVQAAEQMAAAADKIAAAFTVAADRLEELTDDDVA